MREWLKSLLLGDPARHMVAPVPAPAMAMSEERSLAQVVADTAAVLRCFPVRLAELAASDDGYEREAVLLYLADKPGPRSLALIVARLNDWVPQVRAQALLQFRRYLEEGRVDDVLGCLGDICELPYKQRADHAELVAQTFDLLLQPRHVPALRQRVAALRGQAARHALQVLLQRGDVGEVVREGMRHADPSVRQQALTVGVTLAPPTGWHMLMAGLTDRASAVRSQAVRLLMSTPLSDSDKLMLCRRMLLDPSLGPRETACWQAARLGENLPQFYRTALLRPDLNANELAAALWEAVTHKLPEVAPLAARCLAHQSGAVRIAALRAMLQWAPERREALLEQVWQHGSPKLQRFVLKLIGNGLALEGDAVYRAAHAAWQRSDHWLATVLTDRLSEWAQLVLWLDLARQPALQDVVRVQLHALDQPYNTLAYARPYRAEAERLQALLAEVASRDLIATLPNLHAALQQAGQWPAIKE